MSRVAVLIEHRENRRLLASWLVAQHHEIVVAESPDALTGGFDLGIVDAASLERYAPWIQAAKEAEHPVFLPFLLVTHHRLGGVVTSHVLERVDELIVSPVEKLELQARVEILLRARALSVANAALGRRLEAELSRAREVQAALLPDGTPSLEGFDLAARCVPARGVGGDFFDWQPLNGAAVMSVGDVMGKGVPAALLAATVRAVLRALARHNAPGVALDLLRETLSDDLERTSSFVTLFHAHLEAARHEIRYVDAGHGHALVRRANGRFQRLERGGRPVGFPAAGSYRESTVSLTPGDALFVYSDGLIEGRDVAPEDLIAKVHPAAPATSIVDELVASAPGPDLADDVTVLVLKRLPLAA